MFDRVLCVNLDRRADRWSAFRARLPSDWPFAPVERWQAVDGQAEHPPRWYGHDANQRERLRGAWGCLQSHLAIWRECAGTCPGGVLIFEDDAVLCRDFATRARAFCEALPADWDQAYFGGQHLYHDRLAPLEVSAEVIRGRCVNRTHAYAIRPRMMRALVERLGGEFDAHHFRDFHVDHQIDQLHATGTWNIYCPREWLAGQAAGGSDVMQGSRIFKTLWWKEFPVLE